MGKSTAIIQYMISRVANDLLSERILYIPVDHFIVAQRSLFEIAEAFYQYGGELLCFDEIHKYPAWSKELKSIYDSFTNLKIIASGSSAMEIEKGSHDLSRRAIVYRMAGLSFREFLELSHGIELPELSLASILNHHEKLAFQVIDQLSAKGKKILPEFRDYLKHGYFPFIQEYQSESIYFIALEQGLHTTIESDLLSIYPGLTGASINKLKKLFSIIAESAPMIPDMKRLKNIIEVGDERTLKNYLKYLEDAKVISCLYKSGKGLKSLEKPAKIYLNNTNQAYAICPEQNANIGTIREIFFSNILMEGNRVTIPLKGDFRVNERYVFEVGGKGKSFTQIKDIPESYLALGDIETGVANKIPLWLFGFLY
ncbi:MAG: AAA family ATPase [Proteobacteria bacterium]|nr:AAA family ATPase [Pseudomonadota bacterium]